MTNDQAERLIAVLEKIASHIDPNAHKVQRTIMYGGAWRATCTAPGCGWYFDYNGDNILFADKVIADHRHQFFTI